MPVESVWLLFAPPLTKYDPNIYTWPSSVIISLKNYIPEKGMKVHSAYFSRQNNLVLHAGICLICRTNTRQNGISTFKISIRLADAKVNVTTK